MSAPGTVHELIDALRVRGAIAADAPLTGQLTADSEESRPWFIMILQAVAGWLAGICTLVFVGLLFGPKGNGAIAVLGVALLAAAWLVYFLGRRVVFLDQLALAISVAGQFALAWVIFEALDRALPTAVALLAVQIVIFLIMPNKMARTLAALFACIAWVFTVRFALRPGFGEQMFFDAGQDVLFPMFGFIAVTTIYFCKTKFQQSSPRSRYFFSK